MPIVKTPVNPWEEDWSTPSKSASSAPWDQNWGDSEKDPARQELPIGVAPSQAGGGRGNGSLQLAAEVQRQSWRNDPLTANRTRGVGFLATGKGLIDRAMQSVFGSQAESEAKKVDMENFKRDLQQFGDKTSEDMDKSAKARADFVKRKGRYPVEENEDGTRREPKDWQ